MIRRSVTTAALLLLAAAPLCAQGASDPDKKTAGGALPAGWSMRKDQPKGEDASVAKMGEDVHITSGGAAIYWRDKDRVSGPFSASATFTQMKAPRHPEAYGLFFLGNKLDAADQSYFYFLVRGDGKATLKHRAGAEVHTLMDWTSNAAVKAQDANGKAENTLSVVSAKDSTRLSVNGTQVAALPASAVNGAGMVGVRINHNLDVHVGHYTVKSGNDVSAKTAKAEKKPAAKAAKKVARKG